MKKVLIFSAFFYVQGISSQALADCPPSRIDQTVQVRHVYDGDTLQLSDGRKVRLIGLDTPEIHSKKRPIPAAIKAMGVTARKALISQLDASDWRIGLAFGMQAKDHYGRVLAHAYRADGQNIQASLIEQGLAIAFTTPPNDRKSPCYREHELRAQQLNLGIWSMPAYQLKTSFQLAPSSHGFHRLKGRVTDQWEGRNKLTLLLDGRVRLKIYDDNRANFSGHMLQQLNGKMIEVRGWLKPRKGKHPWSMVLRHPDAMTLQK